jgi:hypothetical protein
MNQNLVAATVGVILGAAALSVGAPVACAQESPCEIQSRCCNHGKDAKPWAGLKGGVTWEKSLDEARKRAAREGKPILLYQLVGDLDKEGC